MTRVLHHMRFQQARGWNGDIILITANLGRAEHQITPQYIEQFAQQMNLPLHVINGGDLVEVMKVRKTNLDAQGKDIPFWPSAKARYCTSSTKRDPISRYLRHWSGKQGRVVCAIGMRAEESSARARKPVVKERAGVHTKTRTAYDWLPIHNFTARDVWNALGYELEDLRAKQEQCKGLSPKTVFHMQLGAHPSYFLGNERLSCALCILGSLGDLKNGAAQNPAVYREYVQMEIDSGYSFQPKRWLGDVAPEYLTSEMKTALEATRTKKAQSHPQNTSTHPAPQQLPLF